MNSAQIDRRIKSGWIILAAGLVMILAGAAIGLFTWAVALNYKLIIATGLVIAGWAAGLLVKYSIYRKHPQETAEALIHERDERTQAIRMRAGNDAFEKMTGISALALLFYSITGRQTVLTDVAWFYLAFMVVAPLVIYIIQLARYDRRY